MKNMKSNLGSFAKAKLQATIKISLLIFIVATTACTKNKTAADWEHIEINSVVYGNGKFVTTGVTSGEKQMHTIACSGDGKTWKAANTPFPKLYEPGNKYLISRVVYGNGKFVAYGVQNTEDVYGGGGRNFMMAYSKDGINWKKVEPWADGTKPAGLDFGNGIFVLSGNIVNEGGPDGIDEYTGQLRVSTDGVSWKEIKNPMLDNTNIFDMTFGNGRFVMVGYTVDKNANGEERTSTAVSLVSTDGTNWSIKEQSFYIYGSVGMVFANGKFVTVGNKFDNGEEGATVVSAVSADGLNWTIKEQHLDTMFRFFGFSGGRFVADTATWEDGKYVQMFSTNGLNWAVEGVPPVQGTIFYTTTNLRLRSEPDTSKDNRIAGIPENGKVELLEVGKTERIDAITAPWFKVKTANGTVGWVFSGYLTETVPVSYDYSKILKGDFSEFAGKWSWNDGGSSFRLNAEGVYGRDGKSSDFKKEADGHYTWKIESTDFNMDMALFPVGVEIIGANKEILPSDKTKARIVRGEYNKGKYDPGISPIEYLIATEAEIAAAQAAAVQAAIAEGFGKIIEGDFSDFAKGTWVKSGKGTAPMGDKLKLRADGTFVAGQKASAARRNNNASYSWGVYDPDDGGGFGVLLFPVGTEDLWSIPTDKTKFRMTMGQDFDPVSSPVYYYYP